MSNRMSRTAVGLVLALMVVPGQAQGPPTLRQEEAAREEHQRVAGILEAMAIRPGSVVADVGAGGGFLTVRLARAVGADGRVVAVDTNARVIERLQERVQQEALTNIEIVRGAEDDPHLTPESLDAAVIVNAYHEMHAYQAMLRHLRRALKPQGRLVIVEPLSEKRRHEPRDAQIRAHEIGLPFVEHDVREAGFRIARTEDPFAERSSDIMWLLVAVPDPLAPAGLTDAAGLKSTTTGLAAKSTDPDDGKGAVSSPDLRIAFDLFTRLHESGEMTVVDVRTEAEYRSGHIPGAIWIPLEKVGDHAARLQEPGKPVATYCS